MLPQKAENIEIDIIPYHSDMVLSEGCARFAREFVLPLVGRKSARYNIYTIFSLYTTHYFRFNKIVIINLRYAQVLDLLLQHVLQPRGIVLHADKYGDAV